MANFIRHFDNVLENLEVTGKKVRHFDNDPAGIKYVRVLVEWTTVKLPVVLEVIQYKQVQLLNKKRFDRQNRSKKYVFLNAYPL